MAVSIARNRGDHLSKLASGLPVLGLPVIASSLSANGPPWIFMWLLAGSIYAGLKWFTLAESPAARRASAGRRLAYLLLWPGMDAGAFLDFRRHVARPGGAEWWWAFAKTGLGIALLCGAVPLVIDQHPTLAAWVGIIGVVFVLHFGLFHLLSVMWRHVGIHAAPIMNAPVRASSLGEFWGSRWNRAFRDMAHPHIFRPVLRTWGPVSATLAVFLFSGVVHDLVISLPAGAGAGLPMLYFLIQAVGVLFERSRSGRRLGLGRGLRGRVFCAAVIVAPTALNFHPPFVERVVLPMIQFLAS